MLSSVAHANIKWVRTTLKNEEGGEDDKMRIPLPFPWPSPSQAYQADATEAKELIGKPLDLQSLYFLHCSVLNVDSVQKRDIILTPFKLTSVVWFFPPRLAISLILLQAHCEAGLEKVDDP